MPGRKTNDSPSHSVNHSGLAPPLTLARIQSGWYSEERGDCLEINRPSALKDAPCPLSEFVLSDDDAPKSCRAYS